MTSLLARACNAAVTFGGLGSDRSSEEDTDLRKDDVLLGTLQLFRLGGRGGATLLGTSVIAAIAPMMLGAEALLLRPGLLSNTLLRGGSGGLQSHPLSTRWCACTSQRLCLSASNEPAEPVLADLC